MLQTWYALGYVAPSVAELSGAMERKRKGETPGLPFGRKRPKVKKNQNLFLNLLTLFVLWYNITLVPNEQ